MTSTRFFFVKLHNKTADIFNFVKSCFFFQNSHADTENFLLNIMSV